MRNVSRAGKRRGMQFNSYLFVLLFLPVTVIGFWQLARLKNRAIVSAWLLSASVIFYAYVSIEGLLIIVPSILVDYWIAREMLRAGASERARTVLFAAGVMANVALLGYFKYRNFLLDSVNLVFGSHFALIELLVPLGLSFLTFQKIAFLADVRSGQVRQIAFWDFLLFSMFFPRAIAGPIVRYEEVVPQIGRARRPATNDIVVGIGLFSMGLFKKAVIADSLAQYVPPAFAGTPYGPDLFTAWIGVLAYTFQLYFDFSGYSDMALGVARLLGVRLPMNFNSPYKASSIVEFWSRWHITLTRFLMAYIYTPLVLRFTRARLLQDKPVIEGEHSTAGAIVVLIAVPTFVTMLISGVWHGAGWTFVIWGLMQGTYLTLNQVWRLYRPRFWPDESSYRRVMKPLGTALTFLAVALALAVFRADSLASARSVVGGMLGLNGLLSDSLQVLSQLHLNVSIGTYLLVMQPTWAVLWIVLSFLIVMVAPNSLELLRRFESAAEIPEDRPGPTPEIRSGSGSLLRRLREGLTLDRWEVAALAVLLVLGIGALSRGGSFIYGGF